MADNKKYKSEVLVGQEINALTKGVEIVLINRFGLKNIPNAPYWKLKETTHTIYAFQKSCYAIVGRLLKTYNAEIVLEALRKNNIKFVSNNSLPNLLVMCKREYDFLQEKASQAQKIIEIQKSQVNENNNKDLRSKEYRHKQESKISITDILDE